MYLSYNPDQSVPIGFVGASNLRVFFDIYFQVSQQAALGFSVPTSAAFDKASMAILWQLGLLQPNIL